MDATGTLASRRGRAMPIAAMAMVVFASHPARPAQVVMPQAVPLQVRELVDRTWTEFSAAFPARSGCMAPVAAGLVSDLDGGADARYSRRTGTISILIPTSPARFPEVLTHELAHHLDETCPEVDSVRSSVLESQGFDSRHVWTDGETWDRIPAEHFAESIVQLVRGVRLIHDDRIDVEPGTIDVLASWASGSKP